MRIGLLLHAPGSTNVIVPLIDSLREKGNEVIVYPFTEYARKHSGANELWREDAYAKIFTEGNLDLVIYGTGSLHEIEKDAAVLARRFGVYSISVLDALECGMENLRYYNKPNKVICVNGELKDITVKSSGMVEADVVAIGNPYMDRYEKYRDDQYKELGTGGISVVYASEPNGDEEMNDTSERSKVAIQKLIEKVKLGVITRLTLCVHPRESTKWLSTEIKGVQGVRIGKKTTMEEAEEHDMCVNLGSTIHFECMLMRIHTLRLSEDDSFADLLYNYTPESIDIEYGATERVVDYIESLRKEIK